jgi:hypothetical protein
MNGAPEFQPYGWPHITVIFITIVLPFALAALVRRTKSQRIERVIIATLSAVLILNYLAYLIFIRSRGVMDWRQMLPMQMCDWGVAIVIVAMLTGHQRWFEVAYFWELAARCKPSLPRTCLMVFRTGGSSVSLPRTHALSSRSFPDVNARLSTVPDIHCACVVVDGVLFRGHARC